MGLAQQARALDCGSKCYGFESHDSSFFLFCLNKKLLYNIHLIYKSLFNNKALNESLDLREDMGVLRS